MAIDREIMAKRILDKWHSSMTSVGMMSADAEYIEHLKRTAGMMRHMADELINIIIDEIEKQGNG